MADNKDGTIDVDWDKHADAFNGPVLREHLVIPSSTLAKLTGEAGMTPTQLAKIARTWTDASGQHKIKAKFVKKTDSDVTLRLSDGFEKTVPLDKLSEQDRKLLSKLKKEVENPFAR